MSQTIKIADEVILLNDLFEHGLLRGQFGIVVEGLTEDEAFRVDFTDSGGRVYVSLPIPEDQVVVIRRDPGITMNEDRFWNLIEEANIASNGNGKKQVEFIIDRLVEEDHGDIYTFYYLLRKFRDLAYRWDLWDVAEIINGSCSDDSFTDFRAWLIAQGKEVYFEALRDPETLVDIAIKPGEAFLEEMNYVAIYAYEKKTGEEMPFISGIYKERQHPEGIDEGEIPAELKYPRLAAKFLSSP